MEILQELCAIPTAPFVEDRVIDYVERFAQQRRPIRLSRDQFGNRLLELRGRSRTPRLIFVAHADHPGFVARKMLDRHTLQSDFRGGVLTEYVRGAKVRFFGPDDSEIRATVTATTQPKKSSFPTTATLRTAAPVPAGALGMFDVTPAQLRGTKFCTRVCDDLAGLAGGLAMLDELSRRRVRLHATVGVLVTRAEEVGFIGAIAAVRDRKLLRETDRIISIECSSVQPQAQQGAGVVLRVGDRTSIFNSDFTYFLARRAQALAKRDQGFKYQRALMPGGSCEGTVFDVWGYTTAAVCLPLVNYHNMDRVKKRLAPEMIDVRDWQNMVKLFIELARRSHEYQPGFASLRQRLEKRFAKLRPLLDKSTT